MEGGRERGWEERLSEGGSGPGRAREIPTIPAV